MRVAAATMGLSAYLLPHRGSVKFSHSLFTPRRCGAHIFPCLRVGAARFLLIVYNGVQLEETKLKEVAS